MTSDISAPDDLSPGWHLELKLSDWIGGADSEEGRVVEMDIEKMELEQKLEAIGWGLLFMLFGTLAMPNGTAEYASVAAIGVAMLGLNLFRVVRHMPVAWFSTILGAAIFVAGIGALVGVHMDAFVVFFVLAGAVTIGAAVIGPRREPAAAVK